MDLPPFEARDEYENWDEDKNRTEEMKEDFHWYFGSLLETVQQRELLSEEELNYYNY